MNSITHPKNLKFFNTIFQKQYSVKSSSVQLQFSSNIPAKFFSVNSKFFGVNVQNWWEVRCPNIFFSGSFLARTRTLEFCKTCPYFCLRNTSFSTQGPNSLKKTFFQSKFSKYFHLDTCIAVLTHLDSLFAKGRKNRCSSKIHTKNKVLSVKGIDFPQNIPLDARITFVRTLKEIFRKKLVFFDSKSKENWNNVQGFKHFFPQSLPRLRTLQFRQFWRIFRPE